MSVLRITQGKIQNLSMLNLKANYVRKIDATNSLQLGIGVHPNRVVDGFTLVHAAYNWPYGMLAKQWILSFDADTDITPQLALHIAAQVAQFHYGHQHVLGVDPDEEGNLHVHCLTNYISSLNGQRFDTNPNRLYNWILYSNEILIANNLEPIRILSGTDLKETPTSKSSLYRNKKIFSNQQYSKNVFNNI